jgi:hypothetical protein
MVCFDSDPKECESLTILFCGGPIRDFVAEFNCPFGILVSRDEKVRHYDKKILGVPFSLLCQAA